jgi:hypothetical protein
MFWPTVLSVLSRLTCPVLSVRSTCPDWPVLAILSYSRYPVLTVLSWLSWHCCPVLIVLSWLFCPVSSTCPVVSFLPWLSRHNSPVPTVPPADLSASLSPLIPKLYCPRCPLFVWNPSDCWWLGYRKNSRFRDEFHFRENFRNFFLMFFHENEKIGRRKFREISPTC